MPVRSTERHSRPQLAIRNGDLSILAVEEKRSFPSTKNSLAQSPAVDHQNYQSLRSVPSRSRRAPEARSHTLDDRRSPTFERSSRAVVGNRPPGISHGMSQLLRSRTRAVSCNRHGHYPTVSESTAPASLWQRTKTISSSITTSNIPFYVEMSSASASTPFFGLPDTSYYWSRFTEVASNMAGWKSDPAPLDTTNGDEIEDDGHLFRVMRDYHLKKAQSLEELPDWLFSETERRKCGSFDGSNRNSEVSLHHHQPRDSGTRRNERPIRGLSRYPNSQNLLESERRNRLQSSPSRAQRNYM